MLYFGVTYSGPPPLPQNIQDWLLSIQNQFQCGLLMPPKGTSLVPLLIMVASLTCSVAVLTVSDYLAFFFFFSSLVSSRSMKVEKLRVLVTSLSTITRKHLAH